MAIKKNELYSSLWASCDKLRGGMDASQYKDSLGYDLEAPRAIQFNFYQPILLLKWQASKAGFPLIF